MANRNRTIPDDEAGIRRFVFDFSRTVAADPGVYHLTQADADLLIAEADALIAASVIARRTSTRTRPSIQRRDTIRKRVLAIFRSYVQQIRATPEVTAVELTALNIVIARRRKSPTPPPAAPPGLMVTLEDGQRHKIVYETAIGSFSHRKPRGATHLVLLCHVGETAGIPGGDPANLRYVGAFTRTPIRVTQRPVDYGKTVTYLAAWLTSTGKQSAWSEPVSMKILSGDVLPASMKLAA